MAKKKEKERSIAADLYINKAMTLKAISEIVDVSEKTLGAWCSADDWEYQRDQVLATPSKIRAILMGELKTVSEGGKPAVDTDALSKIAKVIQTVGSNKISVQTIIDVVMMLDNFVSEQNPQVAIVSLPLHKKFIAYQISVNG